jgi:glyoxylase-like metal-dependent hydrolase (beta-lactamase superfamily II)
MKHVANPEEIQNLLHGVTDVPTRQALQALHPGVAAAGEQLREDYNFDGIELVLPTTLFDTRYELDLDGTRVQLIYVGPCHQVGDTIVHVPKEGVVFAGDVIFRQCTPLADLHLAAGHRARTGRRLWERKAAGGGLLHL